MKGTVVNLNIKEKKPDEVGLPKQAINKVMVIETGMVGDYNNYRFDHLNNTPDQALLIMPLEMITQLNSEGWPIKPGDIGENITTRGIAYAEFKPDYRFKVGEVEFQVTYACTPCNNLEHLPYVGKEKSKVFIKTMLHRRGWYAKVLKTGNIRIGDTISKL